MAKFEAVKLQIANVSREVCSEGNLHSPHFVRLSRLLDILQRHVAVAVTVVCVPTYFQRLILRVNKLRSAQ